jgi:hypothetical protein
MGAPAKTTALACALLGTLALAACGGTKSKGEGVKEPATEGLAVPLAGVNYNVFITRELNPRITPDKAYYSGPEPGRGQTLYGVFLQTCNKSEQPHRTAGEFKVVDNQGNSFKPTPLPASNPFAYQPRLLLPLECQPEAGSVAQQGPTAGSMLLFKLPLANTENRPLELEISTGLPGQVRRFELDL